MSNIVVVLSVLMFDIMQYRTTTYSALAKSQQMPSQYGQQSGITRLGQSDNKGNEAVLLFLSRNEPRVMKLINSFLGMNDKQSLMFAVTEEKEDSDTDEQPDDITASLYVYIQYCVGVC
jgi:hypothetical protein